MTRALQPAMVRKVEARPGRAWLWAWAPVLPVGTFFMAGFQVEITMPQSKAGTYLVLDGWAELGEGAAAPC